MRHSTYVAVALIAGLAGFSGAALAQNDPPGQAGRLAFVEGVVSFHDDEQSGWSAAAVNTPLTSGDAIWTEPDARSEISVAGTRVRLDGGTQLDMLEVDDAQTRLQIDRGKIDIKAFVLDSRTPYRIVTPRGTVTLQQQGDYYVEAGTTMDATRLGVRSGAAQIQDLNGQTLAVRAGEVGEIDGDVGALQLRTVNRTPPPPAPYWAARDRQINYDLPAQYLSAGVTGYEDLNAYGSWSKDSQYGNVWSPRTVPADWQPYRTGHWSYVRPWGWTWIDDQPWGYAPYHYGRWANSNNRWVWVPPQRDVQPVYAPALVAFIGGIELAITLGNQNNAPVGWFPLGPRESYVPPYTTNRDYYNRINRSAQVQQTELDDRWQRTQRREPATAGPGTGRVNQRFATVVPAQAFVQSQPIARAALKVAPEKLAAMPVALVSTPPAPAASLAPSAPAPTPALTNPAPSKGQAAADAKARADAKTRADARAKVETPTNIPVAKTAITDMPTLGKPAPSPNKPTAPGPKATAVPSAPVVATTPTGQAHPAPPQPNADKEKAAPSAPSVAKGQPSSAAAPTRGQPAPTSPAPAAPTADQNRQPTHDPGNQGRNSGNPSGPAAPQPAAPAKAESHVAAPGTPPQHVAPGPASAGAIPGQVPPRPAPALVPPAPKTAAVEKDKPQAPPASAKAVPTPADDGKKEENK